MLRLVNLPAEQGLRSRGLPLLAAWGPGLASNPLGVSFLTAAGRGLLVSGAAVRNDHKLSGLTAIGIYSLTVLEARSPKSSCRRATCV